MINFDSPEDEIYQYTDYFDKNNKINSFTCENDKKNVKKVIKNLIN